MYCSNCGKELANNAKFCSACGTDLNRIEFSTDTQNIAIETKLSTVQEKTKQRKLSKKAIVTAIIILIVIATPLTFLGITGIRFNSNFIYQIKTDDGHTYISINKYLGKDTNINIPEEINGYPVEFVGWCFQDNDTIVSVYIPDTVTQIAGLAFEDCDKLKTVRLSNSIETVDRLFYNCPSLESVNIPDSADFIMAPFKGCYNLKNVTCSEYTLFAEGPKLCSGTYISSFGNTAPGIFVDCPNVLLNGKPVPVDTTEKDVDCFIDPSTGEESWH